MTQFCGSAEFQNLKRWKYWNETKSLCENDENDLITRWILARTLPDYQFLKKLIILLHWVFSNLCSLWSAWSFIWKSKNFKNYAVLFSFYDLQDRLFGQLFFISHILYIFLLKRLLEKKEVIYETTLKIWLLS